MSNLYTNNKNNIFLAKHSELQERWDPLMVLYNRKVHNFLFPAIPLKEILICEPQYGASERGVSRTSECQTRYVRITDINEFGMINDGMGATVNNIEDQYALNANDILIARSGATVGKAYIHRDLPYNCIFAGYLIRFVINSLKALPEYVFYYTQLRPYKEWVQAVQRAAAQPNINAEEYKSLKIPLPDIDKQKEIISLMGNAYEKREQKERKAQQLLDGIDHHLMDELGIDIKKHNSKEHKIDTRLDKTNPKVQSGHIFFLQYAGIAENRLDPIFYSANIQKFTHCTYSERLSNLAFSFNNGFAVGRQDQEEEGSGILQIRPTNIDNNGRLKYDKNVYVPEMEDILFVESGVVLFNNTNSQEWVGKTAYFANEDNRKVYISNHITAITVDRSKILPEYLCAILNMYQRHKVFYSICTNWNNQSGVGLDLLKSLHIPMFTNNRQESLRRQQQIVDRINAIYQEVDECILSATHGMNEAKAKVERMIIGK
mgnify:CR=1 FL=1